LGFKEAANILAENCSKSPKIAQKLLKNCSKSPKIVIVTLTLLDYASDWNANTKWWQQIRKIGVGEPLRISHEKIS
jgi:hypothetical protein